MSSPQTITSAFAGVATSTEKTALLADFNALNTELATTQGEGAFSAATLEVLQGKLVDFAAEVAQNMISHTD